MLNQSNYSNNIAFSRDVTAAMLVFQKKKTVVILVYQACPLRAELYLHSFESFGIQKPAI